MFEFDDADLVHRYTRADAIRDGVLIDVSAVAREAGIRYPVTLTGLDASGMTVSRAVRRRNSALLTPALARTTV